MSMDRDITMRSILVVHILVPAFSDDRKSLNQVDRKKEAENAYPVLMKASITNADPTVE